jgi:peptide subunit release factor 1 (eRF1)
VGPLDALVHRLATVQSADARVVSCYLKLEPRDRARQKYAVKLKNRVKDAIAGLTRLGLDHPTREAVTRDLHRVQDAVRDPAQLPGSHGIAIFACEALDLFETVPLPFVYRSRLLVDRTPLVRELASVEDEFGRYLAVVLDRTGARFFEITAFDAREPIGIRADNTRGSRFRSVDGDISEWHYNNRIRQEKQRHYEAVARALFNFDRRQPAHGIVIAAPGPEAGAVRPFLHSYLADRLLGTAKLSPRDATPALVHEAVLAVREQHERATERALTDQMREAVGTGWAFNGTRETLRALAYGQVRTLLVHPDAAVPGFRCGDSGRLALHQRDCRGEGEPIPVLDVIDDAIEEALRQRVDVNVVYDADAAAQIDGLAALLRFR